MVVIAVGERKKISLVTIVAIVCNFFPIRGGEDHLQKLISGLVYFVISEDD